MEISCKVVDIGRRVVGREEGLDCGLGATQAETLNALGAEVDFTTDEAMGPVRVDLEAMGQDAGAAVFVGTADENGRGLRGDRKAFWGPVDAPGSAVLAVLGLEVVSLHEAVGAPPQLVRRGVVEAFPDLGLPEVVERLDLVLEAMFAGWREDGSDAQAQAEEGDGAEAIGVVVRAVKAQVVVELGVGGQAMLAPVKQQGVAGELGGDGGSQEAAAKAAVQGDRVEDLDFRAPLDDQSFDHIQGVQFGVALRDLGQMPTRGRGWAAQTPRGADQRMTLEDVGDARSAGQGWRRCGSDAQGPQDGHRSEFAQGVAMAEVMAQREDLLDEGGGESARAAMRTTGAVVELEAVQALLAGAVDPILDVGKGHAEAARDFAQRQPPSRQTDDLAAMLGRQFFMVGTLRATGWAVSSVPASLRSASTPLTAQPVPSALTVITRY